MVARKASSKAGSPSSLKNDGGRSPATTASPSGIEVTGDGRLSKTAEPAADTSKTNDGGPGPASSLKTKTPHGGDGPAASKRLRYSVQIHTDEKGLEVFEPVDAESGDEAAQKALAKKNYRGASVRGVTPYSDPDPNSLGGEREAGIMYANAGNEGAIINTLGTEANRLATEKLGKADVTELGQ